MFVTWKTKQIMELEAASVQPVQSNLIEGLHKYSIVSALQDGRFDPIKAAELESLICSISLWLILKSVKGLMIGLSDYMEFR